MFDSLQDLNGDPGSFDDFEGGVFSDYVEKAPAPRFLGMTAGQRFVISLTLLLTVVVVGMLCLLVTEKVLIF
jgi:hypothetical protein